MFSLGIEFFASMGKKLMRKGEGARPMMLSASDADYYQSGKGFLLQFASNHGFHLEPYVHLFVIVTCICFGTSTAICGEGNRKPTH